MTRSRISTILVLSLLGGCTIPGGAPYDQDERVTQPRVEPASITVIPSGPTIASETLARVEAENPHGSIRIHVDSSLTAPTVSVKPFAPGGLTNDETKEIEDNLSIIAETILEDNRMVLRASAALAMDFEGVRLDMLIRTPDSSTTVVRNSHGIIELVGVGGQIVASSGEMGGTGVGGDILIRSNTPIQGPVYVSTTSGDIRVFAVGESAGEMELTSDDGSVEVNVESGSISNVRPEDSYYTGILNNGRNVISIRTNHGKVSFNIENKNWERSGPFEYARSSRDR